MQCGSGQKLNNSVCVAACTFVWRCLPILIRCQCVFLLGIRGARPQRPEGHVTGWVFRGRHDPLTSTQAPKTCTSGQLVAAVCALETNTERPPEIGLMCSEHTYLHEGWHSVRLSVYVTGFVFMNLNTNLHENLHVWWSFPWRTWGGSHPRPKNCTSHSFQWPSHLKVPGLSSFCDTFVEGWVKIMWSKWVVSRSLNKQSE